MTSPIPDDSMRTRVSLIVAISALGIVIVVMAAWAILRPHPKAAPPRAFTPATETSASAATTDSAITSSSVSAGSPGTTGTAGTTGASGSGVTTPTVTRAAKVAYRQGGSIYVADEDGGSPKQVTQAADGVFALSPDGHTLAVARGGSLLVYDVASGKLNFSALAEKVPPVWLPDSSAVMFMRVGTDGAPRIYRVPSSGGSEVALGTGVEVAVSPNGADLALLPSADSGGPLLLSRNGGPFTPVTVPGGDPLEVAFGGGRLFVSTISASQGGEIWSLSPDGSDATRLVKPGSGSEKGATFGRLLVSPSGSSLLYAAESDDGYSRMWIVPAAGGTPLSLSSRRDNYPLQWSISGKEILFIEGNAFQGEPTSLLRVSPSGSRRLSLVSGAGL